MIFFRIVYDYFMNLEEREKKEKKKYFDGVRAVNSNLNHVSYHTKDDKRCGGRYRLIGRADGPLEQP
jgi:hypothetical protein